MRESVERPKGTLIHLGKFLWKRDCGGSPTPSPRPLRAHDDQQAGHSTAAPMVMAGAPAPRAIAHSSRRPFKQSWHYDTIRRSPLQRLPQTHGKHYRVEELGSDLRRRRLRGELTWSELPPTIWIADSVSIPSCSVELQFAIDAGREHRRPRSAALRGLTAASTSSPTRQTERRKGGL